VKQGDIEAEVCAVGERTTVALCPEARLTASGRDFEIVKVFTSSSPATGRHITSASRRHPLSFPNPLSTRRTTTPCLFLWLFPLDTRSFCEVHPTAQRAQESFASSRPALEPFQSQDYPPPSQWHEARGLAASDQHGQLPSTFSWSSSAA
jgi:hypothetical protein